MTLDDFLNHIEAGGALNTPEIYRLMDEMSDRGWLYSPFCFFTSRQIADFCVAASASSTHA